MKSLTVVALCVVFVAVVWARPEEEKYEDLAAGVDIDEVLENDRLRKNYNICFQEGKGCTTQAKKVKELIPEALTTGCAKCTDVQKDTIKKVFRFMIKNHPDEFLALEKVYDPERIYRAKYAKEFTGEGLVLPD